MLKEIRSSAVTKLHLHLTLAIHTNDQIKHIQVWQRELEPNILLLVSFITVLSWEWNWLLAFVTLSSSKNRRPTALHVGEAQGTTNSSVGHFHTSIKVEKELEHLSTVKQQLLMPLWKLGTRQRPLSLTTILDPLHLQSKMLLNNKKFTVTRKSCRPRKIRNIMFMNALIGRQRQHGPRETWMEEIRAKQWA